MREIVTEIVERLFEWAAREGCPYEEEDLSELVSELAKLPIEDLKQVLHWAEEVLK